MDESFPKSFRLLKPRDYRQVFEKGKRHNGRGCRFYFLPNGFEHSRFGISVGRRFGTAVRRNLMKRRIREAIRKTRLSFCGGFDIVIYPNMTILAGLELICSDLESLFVRLAANKEIGICQESRPG